MKDLRAPASVRLSTVVERLDTAGLLVRRPEEDAALSGVTADSREVADGDLFCAWAGTSSDAHAFVADAVAGGAAAVVVERPLEDVSVPQVVVSDGRTAAALAAHEVMGRPSEGLLLAGVTGTNGKTTTVWLLQHLLSGRWGTASLGTVGAMQRDGIALTGLGTLTTPGPVGMAKVMRAFADQGTEAVTMEVSSHALDQSRAHALRFDVVGFTNLTRDHLDYHGSFERYRATKRELVDLLATDGTAVLNAEESAWDGLERRAGKALRYAVEGGRGSADADVMARGVDLGPHATRFTLSTPWGTAPVRLPLLGAYNVQNALCAAASALALGLDLDQVVRRLESAPQVPGRLELLVDRPCRVFRDYAHTPDALESVLGVLRPVTGARLWVVFGAGGDRDAGKRPMMGAVASRLADRVVVTSDNPRTEDPGAIIEAIVEGVEGEVERILDRREAIVHVLGSAGPDDVILLAGKGHEAYQVIGTETVPFDEGEIVRDWLATEGTGEAGE